MFTVHGDAELWLDPRRLLIFDPASGENLTLRLPH